ncbi:tetratricopeptide repeat protein [Ichthyobacterium seriolicida]|uniref:TPR-domain containing protein n=1 Tax=Ichthyobacterium seriolicida TaxID=242600 RepID=A0A1J1EBM1_9FLAO|nr:tetratricopeptide repeat protein [Ichthyobacterium seriolicida]BAV95331.1 TPR-domain containing protein [Ichthyobacterium seriolicida]
MFKKIVACLLFCSQIVLAQKTDIYTNDKTKYDIAVDLYNQSNYLLSKKTFEKILTEHTNWNSRIHIDSKYYIALCAIKRFDNQAEKLLTDFITDYPTYHRRNEIINTLANLLFQKGKHKEALIWYEQINQEMLSEEKLQEYYFSTGYANFSLKNYESAKNYFSQIDKNSEYKEKSSYYYAYISLEENQHTIALKRLSEIKKDEKLLKTAIKLKLRIYFQLERYEDAKKEGIKFLNVLNDKKDQKDIQETYQILGNSFYSLKEYDKAIEYLSLYKKKSLQDFYYLGYSYYQKEDYKNAIESFNKIVAPKSKLSQITYYQLGLCYIKDNKKKEALNVFKTVYEMDYDKSIQKEANLYYVKLSYEIGNPHQSIELVINSYLSKYPNDPETNQLIKFLITYYLDSNDYDEALKVLEKFKENSYSMKIAYQKIILNKAKQLLLENKYQEAEKHLNESMENMFDAKTRLISTFWLGEAQYQQKKVKESIQSWNSFKAMNNNEKSYENDLVDYNLGYSFFTIQNYENAMVHFKKFIENNKISEYINDAMTRLADSYFALKKYDSAIIWYKKIEEKTNLDIDYASYRKTICYGLIGQQKKYISALELFLATYKKSKYLNDATYDLANAYLEENNYTKALFYFEKIIADSKNSKYLIKAMLKKGLVYFNKDQYDKALETYKDIVRKYPEHSESKSAIKNAKKIYMAQGNIQTYIDWINKLSFSEETDEELEKSTYLSANNQFLKGNIDKAIDGLTLYLNRFPKGEYESEVIFKLGESLHKKGDKNKAIEFYNRIISNSKNDYTEQSLVRLAEHYIEKNDDDSLLNVLVQLERDGESKKNINYAQLVLMRIYLKKQEFNNSVEYAKKVQGQSKLDSNTKAEATILIGRHFMDSKEYDLAKQEYEKLYKMTNIKEEYLAEILYHKSYFLHLESNYEDSNDIIFQIASKYSGYKHLGAKALLIMAKNYYALKDIYQATYTCESILKNSKFEDLVKEAKNLLKEIKLSQNNNQEKENKIEQNEEL